MSRRDQVAEVLTRYYGDPTGHHVDYDRQCAADILALILPETPEEGMVEAMAAGMDPDYADDENVLAHVRAAWTAARKWRMEEYMERKQTLQYIVNTGGNATRTTLREDYEPIGDHLWHDVLSVGYARETKDGRLELTDAGRAFLAGAS